MEIFIANYYIETPLQVEDAAAVPASEQSSGAFIPVPGETDALKQRFAAHVESMEHFDTIDTPAQPGAAGKDRYHRAHMRVSWSVENFVYNLPVLVSTRFILANYWRRRPAYTTTTPETETTKQSGELELA